MSICMYSMSYVLQNVHVSVNPCAWKVEGWRKYEACVRYSHAAVEDSARDNDESAESKRDTISHTKRIR